MNSRADIFPLNRYAGRESDFPNDLSISQNDFQVSLLYLTVTDHF